jgi:SAM-dependent methyltransferase
MNYYDDPANVDNYIKIAAGFDGRELISLLGGHLPIGSRVLELGMGPGKDLDILSNSYAATGSDMSRAFIDRYRMQNPDADLLRLDALTLDTDRQFDAIYSNKVLHHLDPANLKQSFAAQADRLTPGGLVLHSFWRGDGAETCKGMTTYNYQMATLEEQLSGKFHPISINYYAEMDADDSIVVLARKR